MSGAREHDHDVARAADCAAAEPAGPEAPAAAASSAGVEGSASHVAGGMDAADGDTPTLFSLPGVVLHLVYSHLSNKDRCSVRASCKAGATALAGLQEHTIKLRGPTALDTFPPHFSALRRSAPHLAAVTLDLTGVPLGPSTSDTAAPVARSMLQACAGLQHLVVRGKGEAVGMFGGVPAPCPDAKLAACAELSMPEPGAAAATGAAVVEQAVSNGWRVQRVEGRPAACALLAAAAWSGVETARVSLREQDFQDMASEEGQVLLQRLEELLAPLQHVELWVHAPACPPPQLLRVTTHFVDVAWWSYAGCCLENPQYQAAATSGAMPRLRSLACNIGHVDLIPAGQASTLTELQVLVEGSDHISSLLSWPPKHLPSLRTLTIEPDPSTWMSDPEQPPCMLRSEHADALAAAAPALRVLDTTMVQATPDVLAQLHAALPDLEQCFLEEAEEGAEEEEDSGDSGEEDQALENLRNVFARMAEYDDDEEAPDCKMQ